MFAYSQESFTVFSFIITLTSLIIALGGATRIVFDYLQGYFVFPKHYEEIKELRKKINDLEHNSNEIESINFDENIQSSINDKIANLTSVDILRSIEEKFGNNIFENFKLNQIMSELHNIKTRLDIDMKRVSRTASINLALGFATTVIAITYLSYSLLTTDDTTKIITTEIQNKSDVNIILATFLVKFLPRLSVSIFIELFSFFFLKMYNINLEEIKYLNNERTNIEMKLLALNVALTNKDENTLNEILLELIKTERNFILKKDETTVELSKASFESNIYKDTIENLAKILKK
jgi:hypothetical protein